MKEIELKPGEQPDKLAHHRKKHLLKGMKPYREVEKSRAPLISRGAFSCSTIWDQNRVAVLKGPHDESRPLFLYPVMRETER